MTGPAAPELWTAPPGSRVLLFAPHMDDEVIGAGGALCMHTARGDAVRVVFATDGSGGDPDGHFEGQDVVALRRSEARAAAAVTGATDLVFWDLPDGGWVPSEHDLDAVAERVSGAIGDFDPDVIYAPWTGEAHADHSALGRAVALGLERTGSGALALGYEVWTTCVPRYVLDITAVFETKIRALECHASQMNYWDFPRTTTGMNTHRAVYLEEPGGYAEAFVPLAGD